MLGSIAALALAGLASASPLALTELQARENVSPFVSPAGLNVTYQSKYNGTLPNVVIMATGGTIAGSGAGAASSGVYSAGSIGVEALIDAVPDLLNISNIIGYQIANVGSPSINSTIQLAIAKAANEILCAEGSVTDGIVVTHGTDTLEETAFFLDLTVNCGKPVVIVGAMRPATAYSADGPANLLQAVTAAASPMSKDRGALVTMNDRVGSAFYTQKTHVNYVDTFKAPEPGFIGSFFNNRLFYYSTPAKPTFKKTFDVSKVDSLPRVDVIYGHQEFDARLMESALNYGDVKGLILASPNGGEGANAIISRVAGAIPVVRHVRINVGMIAPSASAPAAGTNATISSGLINSQKSRIMLQLALATGADPRETFEEPLRSILYG